MWLLLICVVVGGFYTAWNIGANDVANAVGPSVGAGVLTLRQVVVVAAIFEFLGAVLLGDRVIDTIESGLVAPSDLVLSSQDYIFGMAAALFATGVWLQIASFFGRMPSSELFWDLVLFSEKMLLSTGILAVEFSLVG